MEETDTKRKPPSFGKNLFRIRKEKGLSQEQLSRISGVSTAAISKYERERLTPQADSLCMLARALNVSMDELYNTTNSQQELNNTDEAQKLVSSLYWLWKSGYLGYPFIGEQEGTVYAPIYRYKYLLLNFGNELNTLSQYENPHLNGIEELTQSVINQYLELLNEQMANDANQQRLSQQNNDPWAGRIPADIEP